MALRDPRPARLPAAGPSWLLFVLPFAAILLFAFITPGCDRADLPSQPGDYAVLNNEIRFDGQSYVFRWVGSDQQVHLARTDDVKLVQDERTFLRVGRDGAVLHLAENQSVQVEARDRQGSFMAPWYPFLWGPIGRGPVVTLPPETGGNSRTPTYRYPPSDTFGRDDTLGGNVPSTRRDPPDYARLPNARDTVSGQGGGTGGGAAATNRESSPVGGQSGGTGSGTAASSKGGFRTGPSAYDEARSPAREVTGAKPPSTSWSPPRVGAGGAAGAGALKSPQAGSGARTSPIKPSTGSKGIGGARR